MRRLRTLLRAQARGRRNRPALPDQCRLQATGSEERALRGLQAPDEARVGLREARPQAILISMDWLPETCAYRLRAAGEPLPDWHYLISGSRETVHEAGQSTRGWTVSEEDAGELEYHVVERPL